jgi:uncharacterized protein (TIGR03067 family)/predicted Zn finger-like uncharacterized protein
MAPDAQKIDCPSCGTRLRVTTAVLPRAIKCPRCQHQFKPIPEDDNDGNRVLPKSALRPDRVEPPPRRLAPVSRSASRREDEEIDRQDSDEPDDDQDELRPTKRKKGGRTPKTTRASSSSHVLVILGIVVLVLFLGGGIAGAVWLMTRKSEEGPSTQTNLASNKDSTQTNQAGNKDASPNRSGSANDSTNLVDDPNEHEKLQGSWQVVEMHGDNFVRTLKNDRDMVALDMHFVFKGDRIIIYEAKKVWFEGTYKADSGPTPHRMEFWYAPPNPKMLIRRNIYRLDGETLMYCFTGVDKSGNGPFPTEFKFKKDNPMWFFFVLKRESGGPG